MALANNNENYMSSVSARRMAEDLALLPIWYAQPGNGVLAASAYNSGFLESMNRLFSLSIQLITEPELPDYCESSIFPWGWNPALRKRLLKAGISENKLPIAESLNDLRTLASRKSVEKIHALFQNRELCCGASSYLTDLLSCQEFVEGSGTCVLKAPWSGSGKGLNWCRGTFTKSLSGWCGRILKEQKGVVGEPVYDKLEDFALEFYSDGNGKVVFIGYSSFMTNEKGAYLGNLLAPYEKIEERLTDYISLVELVKIREMLQEYMVSTYGYCYVGYLGVDMMVCKGRGRGYLINPCVEVNLRMNMGVVAHTFRENFMQRDKTGVFYVKHYASQEALLEESWRLAHDFPLVIKDKRLVSGYLSLVPLTPKSRYMAYVLV